MNPRRRSIIVAVPLALVAAAALIPARIAATRRQAAAAETVAAERAVLDADIAFFAERAARDPRGAADRLHLAQLYLRRAHATANPLDFHRAEELARQSLALRTGRNAPAYGVLATALLAQHRFAEAERAARSLAEAEPWEPGHLALRADVLLELGDYEEARALFDGLRVSAGDLRIAPRLARWLELTGRETAARNRLRRAVEDAGRQRHLSRDQVAWYHWRLADFELRYRHWSEAAAAIADGLALAPDDARLVLAAARLALAREQWREAVTLGERALAQGTDLTPLAVLADAWRGAGDSAAAADAVRALAATLPANGPLHRQAALTLLEHDRAADTVYARARAELATRRDVYGFDLVAVAALRLGRIYEARAAMDSALRLGTRDPLLIRHSAAIDAAREAAR